MNDAEYIAAIAEFYKDGPGPEFRAHYERLMHISAAIAAAPAQAEPEDLSVAYFMGLHAAKRAPQPAAQAQHPDDDAVDKLAEAMKKKLAEKRAQGRSGWDTDCTQQRLSDLLRQHVEKGDVLDVANFCAFLFARGERVSAAQAATAKQSPHPEYDKGFSDGWNRCEERQAAAFASQPAAVPAGVEAVGEMRASESLGVAPYADIWGWLQPGTKLYSATQVQAMLAAAPSGSAREPLTDAEVSSVYFEVLGTVRIQDPTLINRLARAIEAAHGIAAQQGTNAS